MVHASRLEPGQRRAHLVESAAAAGKRLDRGRGAVLLCRAVVDRPVRVLVLRVHGPVHGRAARPAGVGQGRDRQPDHDLLDDRGGRAARVRHRERREVAAARGVGVRGLRPRVVGGAVRVEVPCVGGDRPVRIARPAGPEGHLEPGGSAPDVGLGVRDRRSVPEQRHEGVGRGVVVLVVEIGAAHPDRALLAVRGGQPARRHRSHVLAARAQHRRGAPGGAVVGGRQRLHLPGAGADLAREVHARGVLVVERDAARVARRSLFLLGDRAARRHDLVHLPRAAGPARVVVAVVGDGGEAGEHEHGVAGRVGGHVVDPGRCRLVPDEVALRGRDGIVERPDLLTADPLDQAAAHARVVDVGVAGDARLLAGVQVGVRHVDRVAAARVVLHVGTRPGIADQRAGVGPARLAVVLQGEGRVVVTAAPEEVGAALVREPDRVRVGVAEAARSVLVDRLRRSPGRHVLGQVGDAVVHRRPHVRRVVDDQPAVRPDLDRRVRVVVLVEARVEHGGDALTAGVVVGADLDVALLIDPAHVGAPVVGHRARVAEPGPGAVADWVLRSERGARGRGAEEDCGEEEAPQTTSQRSVDCRCSRTSRFWATRRVSARAKRPAGVRPSSGAIAAAKVAGWLIASRRSRSSRRTPAFAGARRDDRELVAPDARHAVALARDAGGLGCDCLKHRVARRVAELVVHPLEVVQVDQDERVGLAGRGDSGERRVEAAPVAHSGQRVELRDRPLARLGLHQAALEELDRDRGAGAGEGEHREPRRIAHLDDPVVIEERGGVGVDEERHQRPGELRREEVGDEEGREDHHGLEEARGAAGGEQRERDGRHRGCGDRAHASRARCCGRGRRDAARTRPRPPRRRRARARASCNRARIRAGRAPRRRRGPSRSTSGQT